MARHETPDWFSPSAPHAARLAAASIPVLALALACANTPSPAPGPPPQNTARGHVFEDRNGDGVRGPGEPGIEGVYVSNGVEIATTDRNGTWQLPVSGDTTLFVIKPTGLRTALDENHLPRFYYLHRETGSPAGLEHEGIAATGPLPEAIDFPLYPQHEASPFRVLVVGDPQPRTLRALDFFQRDVVAELPDHDAVFGVSLGDIVHDDLDLYPPLVRAMGLVGVPWYHVFGNHDMNLDAPSDATSDETFERFFGPATYAFEYANVHFLLVDDIDFRPAGEDEKPGYRGGLGDSQLAFIANYVATVPRDESIVLLMHVPLVGSGVHQVPERDRLFEILQDHPHHWSISAHTHMQGHAFIGPEAGNSGALHHHWNSSTASGSWWRGRFDELGIPHTTMRDGSPNGYSIVTFDGTDYSIRFKPARRPADYQLDIHAPDEVAVGQSPTIYVNVFAASERSSVEMRLHDPSQATPWIAMTRTVERDPAFIQLRAREKEALAEDESTLPHPNDSLHLWKAGLPPDLEAGSHWIEVRAIDMFGQTDTGRRIVRVRALD
ncbi:MAG: metallophosphoesterase [bacterium]|nr:metallophosphoesterase [bacterium]